MNASRLFRVFLGALLACVLFARVSEAKPTKVESHDINTMFDPKLINAETYVRGDDYEAYSVPPPKQLLLADSNWQGKCFVLHMKLTALDAAATSKTVTLPLISAGGYVIEYNDVYVNMVTAFDRTTDGGPSAMTMDIGKSGATAKFAKTIDLQATTDQVGSNTLVWASVLDGGTRQFIPPFIEGTSLTPLLTITATGANINLNNAGRAVICFKFGAFPQAL